MKLHEDSFNDLLMCKYKYSVRLNINTLGTLKYKIDKGSVRNSHRYLCNAAGSDNYF